MTEEDYQHNLAATWAAIREAATTYPLLPGLVYTSPFDFVAQHGREYRPGPWTGQYKRGAQLHCYGNSMVTAAWTGLRYVEGFAVGRNLMLLPHAWNATEAGELVDVTWCNSALSYIGVEFSLERADDALWTGDACVLNDEHRNYPIFQKRWEGEDYTLTWPRSDRLEMLRSGQKFVPPSITEWLETKEQQS